MEVKGIPMPPSHLIFMDKDALSGLKAGIELSNELMSLGLNIDSNSNILEVGCGYGRVAYGLAELGLNGQYYGMDILENRIKWLKNNFTPKNNNYTFFHLDIKNDRYNPKGTLNNLDLSRFRLPSVFDTIFLTSVFTHMYEEDILGYLKTLRGRMNEKSKLIFTMFLLNNKTEDNIRRGKSGYTMKYRINEHCFYESLEDPLFAISYREDFVRKILEELGFKYKFYNGRWSGARDVSFWQNYIVCEL